MRREFRLLQKSDLPGEIEIHTDLLSTMPSALSRKRALKVGNIQQEEMHDKFGQSECRLCDPNRREMGATRFEQLVEGKVGYFDNDFPYLPEDQKVIFLWNEDPEIRKKALHQYKLRDFGRAELYWLVWAAVLCGRRYVQPVRTYDLMRMVAGFNLGSLAGQSQPHFHIQYGWEVVLNRRTISQRELDLYFEELEMSDLVLYDSSKQSTLPRIRVVAPWTPKGQFALDVYFTDKFEITEMTEADVAALTCIGSAIIQRYRALHIENLNIVFANSPAGRKIEPLVVHFVPRVSMTALYEIRGVNVVDTPPQKIAEEFRRRHDIDGLINWEHLVHQAYREFNPQTIFNDVVASRMAEHVDTSAPALAAGSPLPPRQRNGNGRRPSGMPVRATPARPR